MLKFENTQVFNFEGALRGMRNPMNSWNKIDSSFGCMSRNKDTCTGDCGPWCSGYGFVIGPNDLELACKLIKGGTEHRKFLRQIFISVDITAPRYWWQEFDTYKVGTVANSCSTMHRLQTEPFSLDMFGVDIENLCIADMNWWHNTIQYLESLRQEYNESKDYKTFRLMKQALPESFLQKRTITKNYENVLAARRQRGKHRLIEWREDYVGWSDDLPYIITFEQATL